MSTSNATAYVSWPSAPLTERLVRKSLGALQSPLTVVSDPPEQFSKLVQWSTYDAIDHDSANSQRDTVLSSSYTFRKALIRKHFLSRCLHSYTTKHGDSVLKAAVPRTWEMEISFADELDEMWGDELWELGQELGDATKWWILKPGMADRGMGIRLFNSKEALQQIFEDFESDTESDGEDSEQENVDTTVVTSQLRHFIVQEYLASPLLLDPTQIPLNMHDSPKPTESIQGHKFHLRVYCVAQGALTLYLCPRILALFSSVPYTTPGEAVESTNVSPLDIDLAPHLTNTALQTHRGEEGVRLFDELVGCRILSGVQGSTEDASVLTAADVAAVVDQVAEILAETFKAAIETPVHFQPSPNAFELYGVDFLVSHTPARDIPASALPSRPLFQVQLLEVNAEPAIELTGPRLTWVLEDLFISIGKVCIEPFLSSTEEQPPVPPLASWGIGETHFGLRKCLDTEVRGSGGW
ncbi:hypothetical protein PLICRDRAFT_101449 [Plicaturopsis crispa FD-325 SS-3]|nr:hypothetical protein PLICRDRAFT_101449 [Plicaturopsis crispa FD-325 SS-3]